MDGCPRLLALGHGTLKSRVGVRHCTRFKVELVVFMGIAKLENSDMTDLAGGNNFFVSKGDEG